VRVNLIALQACPNSRIVKMKEQDKYTKNNTGEGKYLSFANRTIKVDQGYL